MFKIEEIIPDKVDEVSTFYKTSGYSAALNADDRIFVARRDDTIVGAARLCNEEGVLVLRGMRVTQPLQRKGIGRNLLAALDEVIGTQECFCLPWQHLIPFYSSIGFRKITPSQAPPHLRTRLSEYQATYPNITIMRRRIPARIREASERDADGIFQAHNESIRRVCGRYYTPEQVRSWIGTRTPDAYIKGMQAGQKIFVAESAGQIVGFSVLDGTEVRAVYVHPDYLRLSVGRMLYQRLERTAMANGVDTLRVSSSVNAEAFYQAVGFCKIENTNHCLADGTEIPCIRMHKTLRSRGLE